MLTLKLVKLKQTDVNLPQIKKVFNSLGFSCVNFFLHSFQKNSVKSTHISLLKSPHVHKKAVSQYAPFSDPSLSLSIDCSSEFLVGLEYFSRVSINSGFLLERSFSRLCEVEAQLVQTYCTNFLSVARQLEVQGILIKSAASTRSLVFTVYA